MTAKEEATNIMNKHTSAYESFSNMGPIAKSIITGKCKQHAMVTVEQIISALSETWADDLAKEHWKDVKKELLNL